MALGQPAGDAAFRRLLGTAPPPGADARHEPTHVRPQVCVRDCDCVRMCAWVCVCAWVTLVCVNLCLQSFPMSQPLCLDPSLPNIRILTLVHSLPVFFWVFFCVFLPFFLSFFFSFFLSFFLSVFLSFVLFGARCSFLSSFPLSLPRLSSVCPSLYLRLPRLAPTDNSLPQVGSVCLSVCLSVRLSVCLYPLICSPGCAGCPAPTRRAC